MLNFICNNTHVCDLYKVIQMQGLRTFKEIVQFGAQSSPIDGIRVIALLGSTMLVGAVTYSQVKERRWSRAVPLLVISTAATITSLYFLDQHVMRSWCQGMVSIGSSLNYTTAKESMCGKLLGLS